MAKKEGWMAKKEGWIAKKEGWVPLDYKKGNTCSIIKAKGRL